MRYDSHPLLADSVGEDAPRLEFSTQLGCADSESRYIEDNYIRADCRRVDLYAGQFGEPFSQKTGVFMIFRQAGRRFLERNQSGGGEYSRLAHASTQAFAIQPALGHVVASTNQDGTDRSAESL